MLRHMQWPPRQYYTFCTGFPSLHHSKQMQVLCVCIFSMFYRTVLPRGIWMLVDLKMLNIASGGVFFCGQHHSLIMCTLKVITYQGFL